MTEFGFFETLFSLTYGEWIWGDNLEGPVVWGRDNSGLYEWMAEDTEHNELVRLLEAE